MAWFKTGGGGGALQVPKGKFISLQSTGIDINQYTSGTAYSYSTAAAHAFVISPKTSSTKVNATAGGSPYILMAGFKNGSIVDTAGGSRVGALEKTFTNCDLIAVFKSLGTSTSLSLTITDN